jgi:hypothetical protein
MSSHFGRSDLPKHVRRVGHELYLARVWIDKSYGHLNLGLHPNPREAHRAAVSFIRSHLSLFFTFYKAGFPPFLDAGTGVPPGGARREDILPAGVLPKFVRPVGEEGYSGYTAWCIQRGRSFRVGVYPTPWAAFDAIVALVSKRLGPDWGRWRPTRAATDGERARRALMRTIQMERRRADRQARGAKEAERRRVEHERAEARRRADERRVLNRLVRAVLAAPFPDPRDAFQPRLTAYVRQQLGERFDLSAPYTTVHEVVELALRQRQEKRAHDAAKTRARTAELVAAVAEQVREVLDAHPGLADPVKIRRLVYAATRQRRNHQTILAALAHLRPAVPPGPRSLFVLPAVPAIEWHPPADVATAAAGSTA